MPGVLLRLLAVKVTVLPLALFEIDIAHGGGGGAVTVICWVSASEQRIVFVIESYTSIFTMAV